MKTEEPKLSADVLAMFQQGRKLTRRDREELAKAAAKLDDDPVFLADYQKSLFVEKILEAMEGQGISQSELARRWGKSRQYLSRVLSEDRRVNFTIETIFELAALVGRKIEMLVLDPNEHVHLLRCKVAPRTVTSGSTFDLNPLPSNVSEADFLTTSPFKGNTYDSDRLSA